MARASIAPRVRSVSYHDCGVRLVHGLEPSGIVAKNQALTVVDENLLVENLERLGIPVASHWDSPSYRAACEQDARTWLSHACEVRRLVIPGAADAIRTSLGTCGFGHLSGELDAAVQRLPNAGG